MQQELAADAEDLTRSLEGFIKARAEAVEHSKQALANYEQDMREIGEFDDDMGEDM